MPTAWQRIKRRLRAAVDGAERRRKLGAVQREARRALRGLAAARGPLDPALVRQARDYAGDVLGGTRHAPWLQVYAAVQGRFREGWLPDSYFAEVVRPRVNGGYQHLARYRAANGLFFPEGTLPDVARLANGRVLAPGGAPTSAARIAEAARDQGYGLVFKPDASAYGLGLVFLDPAGLTDAALARLGNGVVQRRLVAHPVFAPFGSAALATLRLGTVIDAAGAPSVRCGYLKLGRARDSHVLSDRHVRVPVDPGSGALAETGYDAGWRPLAAHPDSGAAFAGVVLPWAADCAARALALHRQVALPRYLCWDFAIDADGAVHLLEWEGGVANFAEATQGPCFAGLGWDRLHLD